MKLSSGNWTWILVFMGLLGHVPCMASSLPWPMQGPDAAMIYDDVQTQFHSCHYALAAGRLKQAMGLPSLSSIDKMLLEMTLAKCLTLQARLADAMACLQHCQQTNALILEARPMTRVHLLECYGDIAAEIQLPSLRIKAAKCLEIAYALLPKTSTRRTVIARKAGVLFRMGKDYARAHTWFAIARNDLTQDCVEEVRLLHEEAIQANKDGDFAANEAKLQAAGALMAHCPACDPGDSVQHYGAFAEYILDHSKRDENPILATEQRDAQLKMLVAVCDRHPEIISSHGAIGISAMSQVKTQLGDYESAFYYGKRALDLQLKRNVNPKMIATCYSALGNLCHQLGRYDEALQYFQLAMVRFPKATDQQQYMVQVANYGQELIQNERYAEGEFYVLDAVSHLRAIDSSAAALGVLYLNLAVSYDQQNCPAEAAHHFRLASHCLEANAGENLHGPAQAHIGQATQFLKMGHVSAAEKEIAIGIAAIGRLPDKMRMSKVYPLLDLAQYYRLSGDLDRALVTNQALLRALLLDYRDPDSLGCPDLQNYLTPWYTLEAVDQRMHILWQMYRKSGDLALLPPIETCGQKALALLRKLRQERNSEGEKLKVNEKWKKLYENALQADMELYQRTQDPNYLKRAFGIAEQSKAMMLLEAVVENRVLENDPTTTEMAAQRRALQARMNLLRQQIGSGQGNAAIIAQKQVELLDLQSEMDGLLAQVEQANPKYYGLVYEFDVVTIAELQAILKRDNRSLVEFFYGDSTIYTLVVNPDTFDVTAFRPTPKFTQALIAFTQCLQMKPKLPNDPTVAMQYATNSATITEAIWRPIEPLLRPRVTIIPDGPLSYVSFDAFIDQMPSKPQVRFQDFSFLLERYAISYQYSATFFSAPKGLTQAKQTGILAMAPSFGTQSGLNPLPESAAGVEDIAARFQDVDVQIAHSATKSAFLKAAPQCAILDLATHGKYDRKNFLDSRIYFSADGSGDSLLYLRELYALNLPADLAILEACETGLGDYHQGEGMMSLARGFTYAGCQSVLMSLWEVAEENSTYAIIHGFYEHLADGMPRDEAIAAAKRDYLQQSRNEGGDAYRLLHPFYWSELVLIGRQDPLDVRRRQGAKTWQWLGGGIPSILAFGGLFWYLRRRRRRQIPRD